MLNEKQRIQDMLANGKITQADYDLLLDALSRKPVFTDTLFTTFINPFVKYAGWQALMIGLPILLALSIVGSFANVYFMGLLGQVYASSFVNPAYLPTIPLLLYQICVNWLSISLIFLAIALIFRQRNIRVIDFFGMTAMAHLPLLLLTTYTLLNIIFFPASMEFNPAETFHYKFSLINTIGNLTFNLCFIWSLAMYFFALRESTGLSGIRLWLGFFVAMIFAQAVSVPLSMFFF